MSTPMVAAPGDTEKPVNDGVVPHVEPFQTCGAGHEQLEPFQVWPPVQMLAQEEPFHAVPAAQMFAQEEPFQAMPPAQATWHVLYVASHEVPAAHWHDSTPVLNVWLPGHAGMGLQSYGATPDL